MFLSSKTYSPEQGFSCAFRQWRATHSHCSKLHGYALGFKFTFASDDGLDERNWVMDFGGLKVLKRSLTEMFDHTLIVAQDDPGMEHFVALHQAGIADLRVLDAVGCEKFAEYAHSLATDALRVEGFEQVRCVHVDCFEHTGNSATYIPDEQFYPN